MASVFPVAILLLSFRFSREMLVFTQRAVKPRPSGRGYKAHLNADHNAALNILAAGQAVSACGAGRAQAPVLNQEPAYGAAR